MATEPKVPEESIAAARRSLAEDARPTDDLEPGLFFDDPAYLDSLPYEAKVVVCAVQTIPMESSADRPFFCWQTSQQYLNRYATSHAEEDLSSSVAFAALSLRYVLPDHPGRPKSNWQMGAALQRRWARSGDSRDLDSCIRHYRRAVQTAAPGDGCLAAWHCDVYVMLRHRFNSTHLASDAAAAHGAIDEAIGLSGDNPLRAVFLGNKANLLLVLSQQSEPPGEGLLRESVEHSQQATGVCDQYLGQESMRAHLQCDTIYQEACGVHVAWFRMTKSEKEIAAAISSCSRAQAHYGEDSDAYKKLASGIVSLFAARSEVLGFPITEDPLWTQYLSEQRSDVVARAKAAAYYNEDASEAVELGDERHAEKCLAQAGLLLEPTSLGDESEDVLHERAKIAVTSYHISGSRASCDEAVSLFEAAIKLAKGSPFPYHYAIAEVLTDRLRAFSDPEDGNKGLKHVEILEMTCPPENAATRGQCYRIRGRMLQALHATVRKPAPLKEAITALVKATSLIPRSSSTLGMAYNDLGNAYSSLHQHEDARENLDRAIGSYQSALDALNDLLPRQPGVKSTISMLYNSLGQAMWLCNRQFKIAADLELALKCFKKSLQGIGENHKAFAIRVSNLSCASWLQFETTGRQEPLVEVDHEIQRALSTSMILAPDLVSSLKMQRGLMTFQIATRAQPQQEALYDRAIELLQEASDTDGITNNVLTMILIDRATAQGSKAKLSQKTEDFEAALETFERAEKMIAEDDPSHWMVRYNHTSLRSHVLTNHIPEEDRPRAAPPILAAWARLAHDASIPASERVQAALATAEVAQLLGRAADASRHQTLALQLLPRIVAGSLSRPEQLRHVRRHWRVPAAAAALALAAGAPASEAVGLLESGRAFLWDRLLVHKTPIEDLARAHPGLAAELDAARAGIAREDGGGSLAAKRQAQFIGAMRRPAHLDREGKWRVYEEVLGRIRRQPGFEDFMRLGRQPSDLQKHAVDAPIVYVNADHSRSDALVISKDRVYNIPLPLFSMSEIATRAKEMVEARFELGTGPEGASRAMDKFEDIMAWLWDAAARPILDALDFSGYPRFGRREQRKPKVIWITTGWINILPIHAAGRYGPRASSPPRGPSCVHDAVVSAHATSARALTYSRERSLHLQARRLLAPSPSRQTALLVTAEHTPGRARLPHAAREAAAVADALAPLADCTILAQPTVAATRAALANADLALFACHAQASREDPSRSALLLGGAEPLSVRVLLGAGAAAGAPSARCALACLSSCESGLGSDLLLGDEGLSVAGALHMAGVPHAVSSLWLVDDAVACEVATGLFGYLRDVACGQEDEDGGSGWITGERAAEALDASVAVQRRKGTRPMLWGPFICTGS